jgi:hypothetical protein
MSESFSISQLTEYLNRMELKLARVDQEKEIVELAFHGKHGQWRMVVGIQQNGDVRKLMLVVPHFNTLGEKKRLECLEALMAVNYRIALGKFGLDLVDGEVRLEETIPLANNMLTFEQFRLAFGAMMQTVSLYHSLLSRIIFGNATVQEALRTCEQEYFQQTQESSNTAVTIAQPINGEQHTATDGPELSVDDVMEEVTRLLQERQD